MPDLLLLEQLVVDRQHGAAGIAENVLDALVDERRDHHLGAGHRACHRATPNEKPPKNPRARGPIPANAAGGSLLAATYAPEILEGQCWRSIKDTISASEVCISCVETDSTKSYCHAPKSSAAWRIAGSRPWRAALPPQDRSRRARWRSSGPTPSALMTGARCRASARRAPHLVERSLLASSPRSARRCAGRARPAPARRRCGWSRPRSSTGSRGSRCHAASDTPVWSITSSARTMRCVSPGASRPAISGSRPERMRCSSPGAGARPPPPASARAPARRSRAWATAPRSAS